LYIFIAFVISVFLTLTILYSNKYHSHFTYDHDLLSIQKYHIKSTSRIGGVAILFAFILTELFNMMQSDINLKYDIGMILSLSVVFFIGILEDVTKQITPLQRMLMFLVAALIAMLVTKSLFVINYADVAWLDHAIMAYPIIGLGLSIFCAVGLSNAYNIIDGYNGLSATVAIVNLLSLVILAYIVQDSTTYRIACILIGAVAGFIVFNYPKGKIFLGDGGAYMLGFAIAILSIYIIHKNLGQISPYAVLLFAVYPITEVGFSIYRRKFLHKTHGMKADNMHLHQLIYHRCVPIHAKNKNAQVLPLMLPFIIPQIIVGLIFYKSTLICLLLILAFIVFYVVSYFKIVRFKTTGFLKYML
jgi:UDP-GlcNAc:undecaprenyl-phosphate/decaprenyl-phosphate GlcNAc-1-phosphate transferase